MQTSVPPITRPRRPRNKAVALTLRVVRLMLVAYIGISVAVAFILTMPRRTFGPQTPANSGLAYQDVSFTARDDQRVVFARSQRA